MFFRISFFFFFLLLKLFECLVIRFCFQILALRFSVVSRWLDWIRGGISWEIVRYFWWKNLIKYSSLACKLNWNFMWKVPRKLQKPRKKVYRKNLEKFLRKFVFSLCHIENFQPQLIKFSIYIFSIQPSPHFPPHVLFHI